MIEKKFAFAVKLEEFKNLYEVFDIFIITDQHPDMLERWSNGFSNNDVEVINIFNVIPNAETFDIGSIWDGEKFIPGKTIHTIELKQNATPYIFLDTNKVSFGAHIVGKTHPFYYKKWEAAMTSKVIGINLTDYSNINLGYLWDGQKLSPAIQ